MNPKSDEGRIARMKKLFDRRAESAVLPASHKESWRPATSIRAEQDFYMNEKEDVYGPEYMDEAMLSRRYTGFDGGDVYLPSIRHSSSSIYSSRSEPAWYDKGRRLLYERNHAFDRTFMRASRLRKEYPTDMLLTFYRDYESPEPELRIIASDQRFRNLSHLLDDIGRLLELREQECFIHSSKGFIIRHMNELQDGGVYFFGPPYPFHGHDYNRFQRIVTPDLLDPELPLPDDRKKRKIRILSNMNRNAPPYTFLLDEARHKSLRIILQDINDVLMLEPGQVQRLVTRQGKPIHSVGELFFGVEDVFIAVLWNTNHSLYNSKNVPIDFAHSYPAPIYRNPYVSRYGVHGDYYEPMHLRPFEVLINNKKHIFEPPHVDHFDGAVKKFDIPPFDQLEVEWVYGYNGKNCRNNLFVLPSDEALYFVSKIVVISDVGLRRQRHYLDHTEEIRSIAQHPNLWTFASGQVSGSSTNEMGHIRVWDSKILITLNVLNLDEVDLSVECLAFSQGDSGMKLASISTSGQDWTTTVWDWEDKKIFSKSDPYIEIELACAFDPSDNRRLISCGKNHVYFWNVGSKLATYIDGEFVNHHISEYVTCLGFTNKNELITADSNAFVHVWDSFKKRTASIIKTSHTGSIITMTVLSDGYVITGGGSDRMLTLINYYQMIPTLHKTQIGKENGGIVAIVPLQSGFVGSDLGGLSLLIGTSMNNVMLGSISRGFEILMDGTADQLTAVASHPIENSFLTVGIDSSLKLWSANQHTPMLDMQLDEPIAAVDFYPSGEFVALGASSGKWFVLNLGDSYQIASFQGDRSSVSCISYSTNGNFIAVGSDAGAIFLYHCYDEGKSYRYISNIKSWAERIISLDWNLGDTHLRFATSSHNFEIWNVERRCEERNRTALRNLQFSKETSPVGYYTAGVWNTAEKDMVFTKSDKSRDNSLYCIGTNLGSIRLFHFPCDGKVAPYNEVNVHSGNVSHVSFLSSERGVVSSGESDYCVVQWRFIHRELTNDEMIRHPYPYPYPSYGRPLVRKHSKFNPSPSLAP